MPSEEKPDHAGVKFPPPFFLLFCFLLTWAANHFCPWPLPDFPLRRPFGLLIFLMGLSSVVFHARLLRREGTAVEPWRPSNVLVRKGWYRFSRNPIYLGFHIGLFGVGLAVGTFWVIPAAVLLFLFLRLYVIAREEAYLLRRFGDDYRIFQTQVPRWF